MKIDDVLKGLDCCTRCTNEDPFGGCDDCPYNNVISVQDCRARLSRDAMEVIEDAEIQRNRDRT